MIGRICAVSLVLVISSTTYDLFACHTVPISVQTVDIFAYHFNRSFNVRWPVSASALTVDIACDRNTARIVRVALRT